LEPDGDERKNPKKCSRAEMGCAFGGYYPLFEPLRMREHVFELNPATFLDALFTIHASEPV
jgi:hypothetical protein